ncbi:BrnA antitoxin family protein [Robbsia sp. Bb-Pol-6]|uniref:BrnA antitoxin family protein n=1 Tax=Robbsia betulipollinis TaxID=2981849 RepID=A0ABT3ZTL0_9BURK|nr:BrnA antitoxin family protein [Robbsia betulipollinis]MCY0389891.1 BrnA antitoxin family protein [Robbsia betulipollinis]
MSESKKNSLSDFAKSDARESTAKDYEEIPELDDNFFKDADIHRNGVLVKRGRGRPVGSNKEQMNLRIDRDVIEAYRSAGDGWQTRMNDALRAYAVTNGFLR